VDSAAANKRLVARMHDELLASRDPSRVDEFFAPEFVSHNMPPGFPQGVEGVRRFMGMFGEALPDVSVEVGPMVAEGDLVSVRTVTSGTHRGSLLGVPGSGRRVSIDGVDIVRVRDGRIVEHWGLTDSVGLLRQVGRRARLSWVVRRIVGR